MARIKGSKDKNLRKKRGPGIKKQFCPKGHDTFITGRSKNKHCKVCDQEYYIINKKRIDVRNKEYNKNHFKIIKIKNKEWQLVNNKHIAKYMREKRITDTNFKLITNLRSRLTYALKKNQKAGSAVKDLGCSIEFLKSYIESKFYNDMTWDNWGKIWELDHIKELHTFDLTDREQFLEACHYTNLQPLTIEDHKVKTNRGRKL